MIDGIIYKLFCKDVDGFYIGSTTDFHTRKTKHKSSCNNENDKAYNYPVYKYIRNNGCYDKFDYEILELGEYQDEYCMKNRERYFIETLKPSLNSDIPNRTQKEYQQDNREIILKKARVYSKKRYQDNKGNINQYHREYHKNNKEIINKKQKERYEKNKEIISEKKKVQVECEVCNCNITLCNLSRHKKTQKHINNLNKI